MKNIPQQIYLQIDADGDTPEDFKDLKGVSWCEDRINENDLQYVIKQTILDFIHDEQRICPDDEAYKALENLYDFVESLGKKLK